MIHPKDIIINPVWNRLGYFLFSSGGLTIGFPHWMHRVAPGLISLPQLGQNVIWI
jgi:hypothetical protein